MTATEAAFVTPRGVRIVRQEPQRQQQRQTHRFTTPLMLLRMKSWKRPPPSEPKEESSSSSQHQQPTTMTLTEQLQHDQLQERVLAGMGVVLHTLGMAALILLVLYDLVLANFPTHLYIR
mmetsp:Transcript_1216/g.2651  ORF Transcript_1216/g.2651 Transcript_1216/m.2651 type:complete len:120 (+) Transcript_1216:161-520(+)